MMVQKIRKTGQNYKIWIALLLIGVLMVQGQPVVVAQETGNQSDTYIKDSGLRKAINNALNQDIKKENQSYPLEYISEDQSQEEQIPEDDIPKEHILEQQQPPLDESLVGDDMDETPGVPEVASLEEEVVQDEGSENLVGTEPEVKTNETTTVETEVKVKETSPAESAEKKELRSEEQEITKEDLEKLIVLDAANLEIQEITGLEYAVNLEIVNLDGNEIADISPLGELENLKNFSANGQVIQLEEKQVNESNLQIPNPLKGINTQPVIDFLPSVRGEEVQVQGNTILCRNLQEGTNNWEVLFAKEYEKGNFSGKLMQTIQKATKAFVDKENNNEDKKEKENKSEGEVQRQRSANPRGETKIYEKHYRYSSMQDAGMDLLWDFATKQLRAKSWYSTFPSMGEAAVFVGLAREGDENFPPGKNPHPPYTQCLTRIIAAGSVGYIDYGTWGGFLGGQSHTFQADTGSLLYVGRTDGNWYWNGQRRYDDKMGIRYTQPGTSQNTEHFKVLADGTLRRESEPHFRASERKLAHLNTTIKVHNNHMAVLGDDFLSTIGRANKKIRMRLKDRAGNTRFERITQEGETYYECFRDIQALQFYQDDILEITDFSAKKVTEYQYSAYDKAFMLYTWNLDNSPLNNEYLIQFGGNGSYDNKGYDVFLKDGVIESVQIKGSGIINANWGGKVYLSIGIFNSNGDLIKNAAMLGGNHTMSSSSEVSGLTGTRLKDGDEIVLYAVKSDTIDESNQIRVLGNVENGMAKLDRYEVKPGFNKKVFRYNAVTKMLAQVDGGIVGMDGALKSTVEEELRELSLNPENNGDKKAWLLGLYLTRRTGFSSKNIQKLTGLEYAVNMIGDMVLSYNPIQPETYRSLRNMKKITGASIAGIKLGGHEKAMVDVLVKLPKLQYVQALDNGIRDVKEFGRLKQITGLYLSNNNISDISSLINWTTGRGRVKTLVIKNQMIERPLERAGSMQGFQGQNVIVDINNQFVRDISDFLPENKGEYNELLNTICWSNLDTGRTEVSYAFSQSRKVNNVNLEYGGRVNQSLDVFEEMAVTLDFDGGTIAASGFPNPIYIERGTAAGAKLDPEAMGLTHPQGYHFAGWYENNAGMGGAWDPTAPINANMTLYAKWELPAGEYLIKLNGNPLTRGYDIILKDGTIASVRLRGEGKNFHEAWRGLVYLSIGIFKSNGDLKKKAVMLGNNHTISSTSETGRLQGTVLEDGDEIVIYAVKDAVWDEGDKVRVMGDVDGGMPELPGTGEKPGFNTKVFRYSASTNKLSQVDGTIANMDEALKSTVEEKMREVSLKPESHGDKKAWQLGLYSDTEINFGRKNIQNLTGFEYAVNMKKVSISNNPLKPETYCSLRNLMEMIDLYIEGVELGNQEKKMVDVLVNLPALKSVYAGYNGITIVKEFSRLRQVTDLNLKGNCIRDISPLQSLNTAELKNLRVDSQSITEPSAEVGETENYCFTNPIKDLSGVPVENLTNLLPAGKGSFSATDNRITWSNLEVPNTELCYDFESGTTLTGSELNYVFDGQVKIPVKVFDTPKYKLSIAADYGGMVRYTIGSETGIVISGEQVGFSRTVDVFEGQSVTLEALPKTGFGFLSWNDGTTIPSKTFDMPAYEMEERAKFNRKMSVTFYPNGGEWNADASTESKQLFLSRGEAAGPMMDETEFGLEHPSGYLFAGWYQTADGTGDVWDLEAPVNQDVTLYANWIYNNEAVLLFEVPMGVDLKSDGTGEATGSGVVKIVDSLNTNLLYKNVLVKATSNIRLTNSDTEEFYDVTVWKEDGSVYTDSSQPLMQLHPKGTVHPKQESFILKTPNLTPKKKGKYQGNMVFHFSWE